jgi:hypothetical protein
MVNNRVVGVEYDAFDPRLVQTKDNATGMCCSSTNDAALSS